MKQRSRLAALIALSIALCSVASRAHAQLLGLVPSDELDPSTREPHPENGYWSLGLPRWFLATRSELGPTYAKPYVSAGYGMPHWLWTGVDVNAIGTLEMAQAYGGVRAATPLLDLAWGVRDTWSFERRFLPRSPLLSAHDVERASGPTARYWAWEAEAVGLAPLPHSALVVDFIAVRTLDVPSDRALYDESYRVIVDKPLFFDVRVGAVALLLHESALKLALVSEYLFDTGRGTTLRLGGAFSIQLTDHLEASATLTVPVRSPDRLGLILGSYGAAGLRYRAATGEPHPEPPFGGRFIPRL